MFCVLFAVQTENIHKTVLLSVEININKGFLIITVHKNQIIKEWVHQTNMLSKCVHINSWLMQKSRFETLLVRRNDFTIWNILKHGLVYKPFEHY